MLLHMRHGREGSRIPRFRFALPAVLALIASGIPAQASLIITPTFDSSITSDPNAAAVEGTINEAISMFEATYSNPIDALIYFQEGSGLGESDFYYYTAVNYKTYYDDLVKTDANSAALAGLT